MGELKVAGQKGNNTRLGDPAMTKHQAGLVSLRSNKHRGERCLIDRG